MLKIQRVVLHLPPGSELSASTLARELATQLGDVARTSKAPLTSAKHLSVELTAPPSGISGAALGSAVLRQLSRKEAP